MMCGKIALKEGCYCDGFVSLIRGTRTGKDFFKNKVVSAYRLFKVSAQTATTSNKIYEKTAKKSANSLQKLLLCTREETKVKKHERGWKKRGKRVLIKIFFLFCLKHAK